MTEFSIVGLAEVTSGISDVGVVVLGIGTVFAGLIAIILICLLMGALLSTKKKPTEASLPSAQPAVTSTATEEIPNRQQFIAAVSAAIAEDMGTDISGIRIVSVKKL